MDFTKSSQTTGPWPAFGRSHGQSIRASARTQQSVRLLWIYGMGMFVPCAYFAARYPLVPHSGRLTDMGKLAHYGRSEFLAFAAGIVIMFGLYVLALRETRRLPLHTALTPIFGWAGAFGAA